MVVSLAAVDKESIDGVDVRLWLMIEDNDERVNVTENNINALIRTLVQRADNEYILPRYAHL